MSTSGVWGFRMNGKDRLTYSHMDSYPTGLGVDLIKALADYEPKDLRKRVCGLRVVDQNDVPTEREIQRLYNYADTGVGEGRLTSWYCLLCLTQGNLHATLGAGTMIDSSGYMQASLHCEWAYIINLDDDMFEVYEGYQNAPHDKGRYAKLESAKTNIDETYYPLALIAQFPLNDLPQGDAWAERMEEVSREEDENGA